MPAPNNEQSNGSRERGSDSRLNEARQAIQEYVDELKEIVKKLRQLMH